jgi:GNAT superfamily N-acetyltransferase
MNPLPLRVATPGDLDALFDVRASTRENAIPRERLAELGITPASLGDAMAAGTWRAWVVESEGQVIAFSAADRVEGEMSVIAVRNGFEGLGLGRSLLDAAVAWLVENGCERPWMWAVADPALRAPGFYRSQGWAPTGRRNEYGDEELVLALTPRA